MRVVIKVVGTAVVLVVLGKPPGLAHAQQRADAVSDEPVPANRSADSLVSGVVADVADLPEHKGQECGVGDLKPEVVHHYQQRDAQDEHGQRGHYLEGVVAELPVKQPAFTNHAGQFGEIGHRAGRRDGLGFRWVGRRVGRILHISSVKLLVHADLPIGRRGCPGYLGDLPARQLRDVVRLAFGSRVVWLAKVEGAGGVPAGGAKESPLPKIPVAKVRPPHHPCPTVTRQNKENDGGHKHNGLSSAITQAQSRRMCGL